MHPRVIFQRGFIASSSSVVTITGLIFSTSELPQERRLPDPGQWGRPTGPDLLGRVALVN